MKNTPSTSAKKTSTKASTRCSAKAAWLQESRATWMPFEPDEEVVFLEDSEELQRLYEGSDPVLRAMLDIQSSSNAS